MIFGFKEIYGFDVRNSSGKKFATALNVLVGESAQDAYFYLSNVGPTGRAFAPFSRLAQADYFAPIKMLAKIDHATRSINIFSNNKELKKHLPAKGYDHLTHIHPKRVWFTGIHEGTRVYDSQRDLVGVVYDYLLDNESGRRVGIVVAPLKELTTSVSVKPHVKPGSIYATEVNHFKVLRRGSVPHVLLEVPAKGIKWLSGVPDYSKVKSKRAEEDQLGKYINTYVRQGCSQADIQASLIEAGWDEQIVSEAFKEFGF